MEKPNRLMNNNMRKEKKKRKFGAPTKIKLNKPPNKAKINLKVPPTEEAITYLEPSFDDDFLDNDKSEEENKENRIDNVDDEEESSESSTDDVPTPDDDEDVPTDDALLEFLEQTAQPLHLENAMRITVAFVFTNCFNDEPDVTLWSGKGGVRSKIRKMLKLNAQTKIDSILHDVIECKKNGITYDGKRRLHKGRRPIIDLKSYEAQIIADCVESGFSPPHAWDVCNQYRKEEGLPSLTMSPIRNCIKRLKPLIKKIEKRQQGNYDKKSRWCKARKNWDTQMLIRTGNLKGDQLDYLKDNDGKLPPWFDPNKMTRIEPEQIVWWDETHRKCTIGGQGTTNDSYARFPRDENGKIDVENGTYDETPLKILNVKYEKEVRLCLGCAIVTDSEDVKVGRTAEAFDYSGKIIKSIKNFDNLKKELNASVRKSKDTARWTTNTRIKGVIYEEENVTVLDNIAKVTKEKLDNYKINNVGDLKKLSNERIQLINDDVQNKMRLSKKKLLSFRQQASYAVPGDPPPVIDHRLSDNPWLSKYGEDKWEEEQRKAPSLKNYVCITEVVEHIVNASAKLYKGTKYEDSWVFYHDALSLMTAKKTVEWMQEKDYYKRWFLPVNDLHSDDDDLKKYMNRPVGNSPENMPWDTSLNNDLHMSVKKHISLTWELNEECKQKFSMSSPKRGAYAYQRVLTLVPSSERIVGDIMNVFKSLDIVRRAEGVLVDSLTVNYGRRYELLPAPSTKMGGKRERKLAPDDYCGGGCAKLLHPDAKGCVDVKLMHSRERKEGIVGVKPIIDKMMVD